LCTHLLLILEVNFNFQKTAFKNEVVSLGREATTIALEGVSGFESVIKVKSRKVLRVKVIGHIPSKYL
jgi:hypothetical protein